METQEKAEDASGDNVAPNFYARPTLKQKVKPEQH